jgi:hypothetical protein
MPPRVHLECVVEGIGEQQAVPSLVHRWIQIKQQRDFHRYAWTVDTIVAHNCSRIKNPHDPRRRLGVECYVETAVAKGAHGVLVIIDADDEPPLDLTETLRARAEATARRVPIGVVVANREYEAWFISDMWSLRRRGKFPKANRLEPLVAPEARRDAKGVVSDLLGCRYQETFHQHDLTAELSFNRGSRRRSLSFSRLETELDRLTREARRYALTRP